MTDRLAELRQGRSLADSSVDADDIETGVRQEQDAILGKFNKEADAIDKVYTWAESSIDQVYDLLNNPSSIQEAAAKLDLVEKKLDAVRKRLKRIASENKDLAAGGVATPSSLRIRVSRYTKLGKDFMAVTEKLEAAREAHKKAVANGIKADILNADPSINEARLQHALDTGASLDTVVTSNNAALRYQIEDLRARNEDIQKLSRNIVELHQMFTDMSILVEGQQELINDIEYNVKEVKKDTKKAAEELVEARKHQKSARKKKMCICILVIVIILAIAAAILIPMALRNGWFSGGSNAETSPTPVPPPAQTTQPTQPTSRRISADVPPTYFRSRWYD